MFSFCKNWKNHCSCFIDRFKNVDWSDCCKQHDEDYKKLKKDESTKRADLRLLSCVKKKACKSLAYVMYAAVRVFGRKFKGE